MEQLPRTQPANQIALVAAMESELRHALEHMTERSSSRIGPWTMHRGLLHGQQVVAVATGIGMVNAAAAASLLLAHEQPSVVLNFGCAGAHRDDIHPGDVVVGSGVVYPLSLTILPNGEEQYAGFRYQIGDETILTDLISSDPTLLRLATEIARRWTPAPWPWSAAGLASASVHTGVIASADCWTQDPVRIGGLHHRHGSLCEDMEAAAVAQVCQMFQCPMLAIKDISNNELQSITDHDDEYGPTLETVSTEIGSRSFALVAQIVAALRVESN